MIFFYIFDILIFSKISRYFQPWCQVISPCRNQATVYVPDVNRKLSYRKQIARQQRTHSNNSKSSEGGSQGRKHYWTSMMAAAAGSINFTVG